MALRPPFNGVRRTDPDQGAGRQIGFATEGTPAVERPAVSPGRRVQRMEHAGVRGQVDRAVAPDHGTGRDVATQVTRPEDRARLGPFGGGGRRMRRVVHRHRPWRRGACRRGHTGTGKQRRASAHGCDDQGERELPEPLHRVQSPGRRIRYTGGDANRSTSDVWIDARIDTPSVHRAPSGSRPERAQQRSADRPT